jgi:integrase
MYAGLRRGELMQLRWSDIDLASGVIRVERSWDPMTRQVVSPKTASGTRRVPVAAALRDVLIEHGMDTWCDGLAFGRSPAERFTAATGARAKDGWKRF